MADLDTRISDFLWKNISEKHVNGKKDPFWGSLQNTGTEIWLDTCDIDEAERMWSSEMTGLTTNNTLLNTEIQKGIYDVFISESKSVVRDLSREDRVKEIAFIVNARHGLRMASKFGCYVSLDLHTDFAYDAKSIVHYGKRLHDICPDKFIVKVPYTADGLIGARILKDSGVKVNLTLGFSARQNVLATRVARPDYLNVFHGRIGSFIANNNLGDGSGAGERAVIASQNWITGLSAENPWQTKLIAASLGNYNQIELLAGADVFTIPPKVAEEALKTLKTKFTSRTHENYEVSIFNLYEKARIEKFWEIDNKVLKLSERLASKLPSKGSELIHIAYEEGCGDMFPSLSKEERIIIGKDGKIPVYQKWQKKIEDEKIAPDTLLRLAGLSSFKTDQELLDERIRGIVE